MELAAQSVEALGSVIEIKLPKGHASLLPSCFGELKRIESAFSRFLPSSELSRLNANIGIWQGASGEFLFLAGKAEEFHEKTGGYFDASMKSALDATGYDADYSFKEKNAAPEIAIPPGSPAFVIDSKNKKILLSRQIEFGGFGKGYAQDVVARLLEKNGVHHYCINAGGDIYAKKGRGEEPWIILLEHPDNHENAIGKIELDGKSIAGSAPNRRKWGNGKFHHLINAKTRMPATGAKAIFAIAKTGMEADAYSTAIFTAGFEEGIELSKQLPVEILFISCNDKIYQSPGFGAEIFA